MKYSNITVLNMKKEYIKEMDKLNEKDDWHDYHRIMNEKNRLRPGQL